MAELVFKPVVWLLMAYPAVEFVEIEERLPHLHPGLLASTIFVALLVLLALWAYRLQRDR
ncbi:MAG: hypothetical protein ACE5G5_09050 [Candidatus Methylomirabilales bacterium]